LYIVPITRIAARHNAPTHTEETHAHLTKGKGIIASFPSITWASIAVSVFQISVSVTGQVWMHDVQA
jgi:hypothetical protein